MKVIKMKLSADSINDVKKQIDDLIKEKEKIEKELVQEIVDFASEEIQRQYSTSPYEGYGETFSFGKDENSAWVEGNQVLYREYGTGTEGMNNPHPVKDSQDIALNPYNSGRTIRVAKENINPESGISPGELYWTFYKNGTKYYTKGIPSGKEVYYASIETRKHLNEIMKKKVGELLSKL